MRLRKACEHGRWEPHATWSPYQFANDIETCTGGEFLPADAIVIGLNEAANSMAVFGWPDWANRRLTLQLDGMSVRIQENPGFFFASGSQQTVVLRGNRVSGSDGASSVLQAELSDPRTPARNPDQVGEPG